MISFSHADFFRSTLQRVWWLFHYMNYAVIYRTGTPNPALFWQYCHSKPMYANHHQSWSYHFTSIANLFQQLSANDPQKIAAFEFLNQIMLMFFDATIKKYQLSEKKLLEFSSNKKMWQKKNASIINKEPLFSDT